MKSHCWLKRIESIGEVRVLCLVRTIIKIHFGKQSKKITLFSVKFFDYACQNERGMTIKQQILVSPSDHSSIWTWGKLQLKEFTKDAQKFFLF